MRPRPLPLAAIALLASVHACQAFLAVPEHADAADAASNAADAAATDVTASDASDGPGDSGPALDPDAGGPGVFCGPSYCDPRSSVCCQDDCNKGAFECYVDASCPATPGHCVSTYRCDDQLDCARLGKASDVCCLSTTASPNLADCRSAIVCGMAPHQILCDPETAAPCPGDAGCISAGGERYHCDGL